MWDVIDSMPREEQTKKQTNKQENKIRSDKSIKVQKKLQNVVSYWKVNSQQNRLYVSRLIQHKPDFN